MLNYSIAMLKNPMKPEEEPKAYAKSQINGELSLKKLSQRVTKQTTVSRADVSAVIISTVENMLDGLREGLQVDFGDLGKFRLQITSRGAESAELFTAANITGVNIQFIPGEDLKEVFSGLEFAPVPTRAATRALLKAQKAGQTTVDISADALTPNSGKPSGKDEKPGGNAGQPEGNEPGGGNGPGSAGDDQNANPLG